MQISLFRRFFLRKLFNSLSRLFFHFESMEISQLAKILEGENVCLLKEEKLLIEKLTLIIGGFYQH